MISLSDSQNIDLTPDGDGRPVLPPNSPIQACPSCEALADITDREPLEKVHCPSCGAQFTVHGNIGPFQILAVAGRGGMGVVYEAYDTGLDRRVALKLLRKDRGSNAALIQQLENEASITASVNHPNVVKVFSTGIDRGRFFIAMELVNKGSLDDLIRLQGRIAEKQVLEIGVQIARGLRAAQQHGLIHRDVKPGNILFADAQTSKIVDFGLAIFIEQEESVRGEIWGTPYYVAPEKLDGQPEDFRSDIYSLGGTLFHALAGRPPFEAKTASLVALKHLKAQSVSIATYAPSVSGATAYVINRTLLKNPAERYQSYDELIEHFEYALEELIKAGHQPAARTRVVLETAEDHQRWGWVVLAMLAACVLLIGGLFLFRKPIFGGPVAATTKVSPAGVEPATATDLNNFALADQVRILGTGNPAAADSFRKVGTWEKLSPIDRAWAALLEGTAELNAGRMVEARTAFQNLQALAAKTDDARLTLFFINTAEHLATDGPVAVGDAQEIDRNSFEAIALLLYGLKNWQLGKVDEGAALLRQFRSASPSVSSKWISELKTLASSRLEQITAFDMQFAALKTAGTTNDRESIAATLSRFEAPLAARGRELLASVTFPTQSGQGDESSQLAPLSGGWADGDFGQLRKPSSTQIDAATGTFTLKTASGDIWNKDDSGHFVYKRVIGDFEIVAHITSLVESTEWPKAGLMIREILAANARNLYLAVSTAHGLTHQRRYQRGGDSTCTAEGWRYELHDIRWLKLVRTGDKIISLYSENGEQWSEFASDSIEKLPFELFVGLAASSSSRSKYITAAFDHVEVRPTTMAAPEK